jgi:hypothetical protein
MNDIAGDGCTTSIILAQGLIAEGMKVCLCMNSLRVPHTGLWFYIILFVPSVYRNLICVMNIEKKALVPKPASYDYSQKVGSCCWNESCPDCAWHWEDC